MSKKFFTIGVVGNPNCGKSTVFNALTGAKQTVGNWPGVTVERKVGQYTHKGSTHEIVDLPGTYSLVVADPSVSLDEKIANDFIVAGEGDLILNIVDAASLERNLFLTSQLLEMGVPVIIALNMMDVARKRNIKIDIDALSEELGCQVVPIVGSTGEGVSELKQVIAEVESKSSPDIPTVQAPFESIIETALSEMEPLLVSVANHNKVSTRWLGIRLLEEDIGAQQMLGKESSRVADIKKKLEKNLPDDMDIILADNRYGFIRKVTEHCLSKADELPHKLSKRIDSVVLNRVLGLPIFLGIMYLMFMFTINLGGGLIDFFDIFAGTILVDGLGELISSVGLPDWLRLVVADGLGGGVQVVATFIPVIAFLYLFLSVLEDSGYMARAAFVIDRLMRVIGLPGKSFVPMLVGFGCNVPAIMATRTLEQERERKMTIAMNPFMSCGARLPVYALFAAAFFPVGGQNLVFGLYVLGMVVAVLTGIALKHTLLKGEATPFVMELPRYHLPTIKGVVLRTWDRLKSFVNRAGKIIVPMVLVLNILNAVGTDGTFGNEDSDKSMLSEIGRTITPMFSPMGLKEENWPAAVGIFTGILAKEAVVGTLDALYGEMAEKDAAEAAGQESGGGDEEAFDFWAGIGEAFATIPEGLAGVLDSVGDPLGLSIGDVSNIGTASEEQEVSTGTFGAMVKRYDGAAGAFAYLLFILLYMPCTAAIAAVYRETNAKWTWFVSLWTTSVAYITATMVYQIATFSRHPASSIGWIGGFVLAMIVVFALMRKVGSSSNDPMGFVPAEESA